MSTLNNGIIANFGKKLGVSDDATINKALELQRLVATKRIPGLTGSLEAVICVTLAASLTGAECDKSLGAKLSGLAAGKYRSRLQAVSQLLQLERVTVQQLAVRHGATEAQPTALQVLQHYGAAEYGTDTALPLYQAAALAAAAKARKLKVDRRRLLESSGAQRRVFDAVAERMLTMAEALIAQEVSEDTTTSKRKRGKTLIERVEEKNKEEEAKKKDEKAKNKKTVESAPKKVKVDDEVDDYEDWKRRMLEEEV